MSRQGGYGTHSGSPRSGLSLQPTELQPRGEGQDSTCTRCENGWIYVGDGCRACECQRQVARVRKARGAIDRKRSICRKAGKASGRRRRQLARARRGNARPGQLTAALCYELRQPSRQEFDCRYEALWPAPESPQGRAQWLRGRDTAWVHLVTTWRLLCVRGQHCDTTKPRRAAALTSQGRTRSTRTVRRLNVKLEAMGLAGFLHVRAPLGKKDYLRVEWRLHRRVRSFDVTHPSGTVNYGASPHVVHRRTALIAPASRAVPPNGGDQRQAPSAPGTERGEADPQLSFEELHRAVFGPRRAPAIRALESDRSRQRGLGVRRI